MSPNPPMMFSAMTDPRVTTPYRSSRSSAVARAWMVGSSSGEGSADQRPGASGGADPDWEPYLPPDSPGDPSKPVPWDLPSRLILGALALGGRATWRWEVWPPAIRARTGANVSPVMRPAQTRSHSAVTTS